MKATTTLGRLIPSNAFMTHARCVHLRFKDYILGKGLGLMTVIFIGSGMAFFEYVLQVPANRIGSDLYGGPFSLVQRKTIQEVITLAVFTIFTLLAFHHDVLGWKHPLAVTLMMMATWLVFKN